MEREEFNALFGTALNRAIDLCESAGLPKRPLPRNLMIELHGAYYPGVVMSVAEATDALWLDDVRFWRVIDVMVKSASEKTTTLFVRASGHEPGLFEETWNTDGLGPFVMKVPLKVRERE